MASAGAASGTASVRACGDSVQPPAGEESVSAELVGRDGLVRKDVDGDDPSGGEADVREA
jgi:hypothetical protein